MDEKTIAPSRAAVTLVRMLNEMEEVDPRTARKLRSKITNLMHNLQKNFAELDVIGSCYHTCMVAVRNEALSTVFGWHMKPKMYSHMNSAICAAYRSAWRKHTAKKIGSNSRRYDKLMATEARHKDDFSRMIAG